MEKFEIRVDKIIDLSMDSLYKKINAGMVKIDNEASLQLQLSYLIKILADVFLYSVDEKFSIELEKSVINPDGFGKSGSNKARIDIFLTFQNIQTDEEFKCAIELKYFKKENHREPNNRYDVFKDILHLENYKKYADKGFLIVATDHKHYVEHPKYSDNTKDFDFRHNSQYKSGTKLVYNTEKPHGEPIILNNDYEFLWKKLDGINFLKLEVIL